MFFLTYLGRELRRRMRQAVFIAIGLAVGIGLVITVIGAVSAIVNIWLTYVIITKPQIIGGGFSASEVAGLIVVFFWGLLAYVAVRIWTRHRGIGFGLATRELPPE